MTQTTPRPYVSRRERRDRRAFRRSLVVIGVLLAIVVAAVIRLNLPQGQAETKQTELALPTVRVVPVEEVPRAPFTDVTQSAGITFVHENGAAGDKLLPETMGSGWRFVRLRQRRRWRRAAGEFLAVAVGHPPRTGSAADDGPLSE